MTMAMTRDTAVQIRMGKYSWLTCRPMIATSSTGGHELDAGRVDGQQHHHRVGGGVLVRVEFLQLFHRLDAHRRGRVAETQDVGGEVEHDHAECGMILGEFGEEGPEHGLRHPHDHLDQPRLVGDPEHPEPERDHPYQAQREGHRGLGEVDRCPGDRHHLDEPDRRRSSPRRRRLSPRAPAALERADPEVVVPLRGHARIVASGSGRAASLANRSSRPSAILQQLTGVSWARRATGRPYSAPPRLGGVGPHRHRDGSGPRIVAAGEGKRHRHRLAVAVGISPEVAHVGDQREDEAQDDEPGPDVVEHAV